MAGTPYRFDPPITAADLQRTMLGRCLLAGRLVATAVSPVDGTHITIRVSAKAPPEGSGRWRVVPFFEARKVYLDVPGADLKTGDSIGDFNVSTSTLWATNRDERRVNAARYIMLAAAGRLEGSKLMGADPAERERIAQQARELIAAGHDEASLTTILPSIPCGYCGRLLTDPVSITRGIGPKCYGRITGSQHQVKDTNGSAPATLEFSPPDDDAWMDEPMSTPRFDSDRPRRSEQAVTTALADTEAHLGRPLRDDEAMEVEREAEKLTEGFCAHGVHESQRCGNPDCAGAERTGYDSAGPSQSAEPEFLTLAPGQDPRELLR